MLDIKVIRENPEKVNELLKEETLTYQQTKLQKQTKKEEKYKQKPMNSAHHATISQKKSAYLKKKEKIQQKSRKK